MSTLSKQATVDDDPTGIHWINSDLIGSKQKVKNIKKQRPMQRRKILNLVYYISARAKPAFFGFNGSLHWKRCLCSNCGILCNNRKYIKLTVSPLGNSPLSIGHFRILGFELELACNGG